MDMPFFELRIIIQVGNVHSHSKNKYGENGIVHLLEHLVFNKSKKYPEKHSFEKKLAQYAGTFNATTYAWQTEFIIYGPTIYFNELVGGVIDHIFFPVFDNDDIRHESKIISNERNERKYYPGQNSMSKYMFTEWINDESYSKNQLFGSDENLSEIDSRQLSSFHNEHYLQDNTEIIIGGNFNIDFLINQLQNIGTKKSNLVANCSPTKWKKKEFHTHTDKDTDMPLWVIGGIIEKSSPSERVCFDVLHNYLTNEKHGPIYDWLRKEKGWIYGMDFGSNFDAKRFLWHATIPFANQNDIVIARKDFDNKIIDAICDQNRIEIEINRQLAERVFFYQTLGSRMDTASYSLFANKKIITESEYVSYIESCRSKKILLDIYKKYLSPEVRSDFITISEK